jgi:hypothetical protein
VADGARAGVGERDVRDAAERAGDDADERGDRVLGVARADAAERRGQRVDRGLVRVGGVPGALEQRVARMARGQQRVRGRGGRLHRRV